MVSYSQWGDGTVLLQRWIWVLWGLQGLSIPTLGSCGHQFSSERLSLQTVVGPLSISVRLFGEGKQFNWGFYFSRCLSSYLVFS